MSNINLAIFKYTYISDLKKIVIDFRETEEGREGEKHRLAAPLIRAFIG